MGGAVFVGIRRKSGAEHLYETWTNAIPLWFADPSFIEDGKSVDKFVNTQDRFIASGDTLYAKKHKFVMYSEYGVILIDHVNMKILSIQDYVRPGYMSASWHRGRPSCASDTETLAILYEAGRLELIDNNFTDKENLPKDKLIKLCIASMDSYLPESVFAFYTIKTKMPEFKVHHVAKKCHHDQERKLVRKFLVDNGWNARVYGQKR